MKYVIEFWNPWAGEWRWRIKARNGRILAVSSEGYKSKRHCERMAFRCVTAGWKHVVYEGGGQ